MKHPTEIRAKILSAHIDVGVAFDTVLENREGAKKALYRAKAAIEDAIARIQNEGGA